MKKLYIMFTLILSSFFLFNYNVKASQTYWTLDLKSSVFTGDKFLNLRNDVINYANENNFYYLIIDYSSLAVCFFNNSPNYIFTKETDSSRFSTSVLCDLLYSNGNLSSTPSKSTNYYIYNDYSDTYNNTTVIDTNYPYFYLDFSSDITIKASGCTYTLKSGDNLRGLYDYYVAKDNNCTLPTYEAPDPHKEEKEVLSNFYSLIFEKIDLLANSILSNYIYLTIIVIFILIFLIELIRRYLL